MWYYNFIRGTGLCMARSNRELLKILADNIDLIEESGLCWACWRLRNNYIISRLEFNIILKLIKKDLKPLRQGIFGGEEGRYYWPRGEKIRRIQAIQHLLDTKYSVNSDS